MDVNIDLDNVDNDTIYQIFLQSYVHVNDDISIDEDWVNVIKGDGEGVGNINVHATFYL